MGVGVEIVISDEESAKAAAERIEFFLEHPPHEGTPQSVEFTNLLEALANYQSASRFSGWEPRR